MAFDPRSARPVSAKPAFDPTSAKPAQPRETGPTNEDYAKGAIPTLAKGMVRFGQFITADVPDAAGRVAKRVADAAPFEIPKGDVGGFGGAAYTDRTQPPPEPQPDTVIRNRAGEAYEGAGLAPPVPLKDTQFYQEEIAPSIATSMDWLDSKLPQSIRDQAQRFSETASSADDRGLIDQASAVIKAAMNDPGAVGMQALESLPSMLAPIAAARSVPQMAYNRALLVARSNGMNSTLAEAAARKAAQTAAGRYAAPAAAVTAGLQSGSAAADDFAAGIDSLSDAEIMATSPVARKQVMEAAAKGIEPEEAMAKIRQQMKSEGRATTLAIAGALTTLSSLGSGAAGFEARIANGGLRTGGRVATVAGRTAEGLAKEGAQETFESGPSEQGAQNIAARTSGLDPERDLGYAVASRGIQGGLAGMVMGGGMGAAQGVREALGPQDGSVPPAQPPAAPPPPVSPQGRVEPTISPTPPPGTAQPQGQPPAAMVNADEIDLTDATEEELAALQAQLDAELDDELKLSGRSRVDEALDYIVANQISTEYPPEKLSEIFGLSPDEANQLFQTLNPGRTRADTSDVSTSEAASVAPGQASTPGTQGELRTASQFDPASAQPVSQSGGNLNIQSLAGRESENSEPTSDGTNAGRTDAPGSRGDPGSSEATLGRSDVPNPQETQGAPEQAATVPGGAANDVAALSEKKPRQITDLEPDWIAAAVRSEPDLDETDTQALALEDEARRVLGAETFQRLSEENDSSDEAFHAALEQALSPGQAASPVASPEQDGRGAQPQESPRGQPASEPAEPASTGGEVQAVEQRSQRDQRLDELSAVRDKRPRPLNKMFGQNPTPEQVAKHGELMKAWNREHGAAKRAFDKAEEDKRAAAASLPPSPTESEQRASQREEFEHEGTRVYPIRLKSADGPQEKWAVETDENRAKRVAGAKAGLGDAIFDTEEQAKAEVARMKRAAADRAKRDNANADAAEKEARQAEIAGKSLSEIKALDYLKTQVRDGKTGKVTTRAEWVQERVTAGDKPSVRMVDKVKPMTRAQINRSDNRQQAEHERRVKAGGKVPEYSIGNFVVTKTEHDYAERLLAEAPTPEPTATAAPDTATAVTPAPDLSTLTPTQLSKVAAKVLGAQGNKVGKKENIEALGKADPEKVREAVAEVTAPESSFAKSVRELIKAKSGEIAGALHQVDIGPIDLVYGESGAESADYSDGYGLAHILAKHPEVDVTKLDRLIAESVVTKRKGNTVELETADHRAIIKLDWDGKPKRWLLTAFKPVSPGARIGAAGDTASEARKEETGQEKPTSTPQSPQSPQNVRSPEKPAAIQSPQSPQSPQDKDSFTLERMNQDTGQMEPVTFQRGEYVRYKVGQKDEFGEIDGISQARQEFRVGTLWYSFSAAYKAERPAAPKAKITTMAKAVEAANTKNGAGLTEADRVAGMLHLAETVTDAVRDGTATVEQYRDAFTALSSKPDAVKAELNAKTKDQLAGMIGGYMRPDDKKADLVERVYEAILREFALGKSYGPTGYMMGQHKQYEQAKAKALEELVQGQSAEDLAAYAAEIKKRREEVAGRRAEAMESIKNPKTLDDFKNFLSYHMREGKTVREARALLTDDQRADFDRMEAERTKAKRNDEAEKTKAVQVAGRKVDATIIPSKHTKHGHDLFVVRTAERVSREDFETLNNGAKKLGGGYSSFRGNGAIPGYQFRTREAAEAFVKLANGDATAANETAQARRDAFQDDRSQSAAERLTEMADRLEERADETLNADRKTNTARRAAMANSAEAAARADKALAQTMRNIAAAITEGKAKFLGRLRQKTQVELLGSILRTAKDTELRAKYDNYGEQQKRRGEPATGATVEYAEFPTYTLMRSDLATLAREIEELDAAGLKVLGKQLAKVADDVGAEYTKFAKENYHKVAPFAFKDGSAAIFPNREDAERALKRSGLRGKAIVMPLGKGKNAIVMSPSEAIGRGIWKGDGDKRITLSPEFAEELIAKLGRRNRGGTTARIPWQFETAFERRKALARMGIQTPAEYRSALREFIALREQAQEADRVKEMERAMVGRANDGLDFFPTPQEVADQMVEAAGIEPDMAVLEPSAGMGHIADRIRAAGAEPDVLELSSRRRELLEAKGFHVLPHNDFLSMEPRTFFTFGDMFEAPDGTRGTMRGVGGMGSQRVRLEDPSGERLGLYDRSELKGIEQRGVWSGYDRIVMNPPFSEGRDMEHVRHAYDLLKPGGRLVAIMGEGAFFRDTKQAREFREWLESVGGTDEKLPEGSFMDPSLPVNTGVSARMVVIEKPAGIKASLPTQGAIPNPKGDAKLSAAQAVFDKTPGFSETLEAVTLADNAEGRRLTAIAKNAKRLFGREVVFFRGVINGFVLNTPDSPIFINVDGDIPTRQILGHELLHSLRTESEWLYKAVRNAVDSIAKDYPGYAERLGSLYEKNGAKRPDAELTREEFTADVIGGLFTEPGFMRELAAAMEPNAFKRLANQILALLEKMADKARRWLNAAPKSEAEVLQAYVTDINAARRAVLSAAASMRDTLKVREGDHPLLRAMVAWHGSPHDFEKFSMEAIGTGEGAQAYGHGLYFASNKSVAEYYRGATSYQQIVRDFRNSLPDDGGFDEVMELIGTDHFTKYQERVLKALAADDWLGFDYPSQAISAAYRNLRDFDPSPELVAAIKSSGALYQVDLAPSQDEYLDWDKPLSEQSERVRAVLAPLLLDVAKMNHDGITYPSPESLSGEGLYGALAREFKKPEPAPSWTSVSVDHSERAWSGERAASKHLHSIGIPGIRYKDQQSRGDQGGGSHNYVIFDDSLVTVTAKASMRGQVTDQTQSAAFKRWFGDSKVVDAEGKPLVVYHGTKSPGFAKFNTRGETTSSGDDFKFSPLGAWFTDAPRVANNFATDFNGTGSDGAVMPVYAALRKPFEISYDDLNAQVANQRSARSLRSKLEAAGYDGMKVGRYGGAEGFDYVAFRPEQIKSAIGNSGTFDPSNPSILASLPGQASDRPTDAERVKPTRAWRWASDDFSTDPVDPAQEAKNSQAFIRYLKRMFKQGASKAGEGIDNLQLGLMTLRMMRESYAKVFSKSKGLERYSDATEATFMEAMRRNGDTDLLAQRWAGLGKDKSTKLSYLMHDATLAGVRPNGDVLESVKRLKSNVADIKRRLDRMKANESPSEVQQKQIRLTESMLKQALSRLAKSTANHAALQKRYQALPDDVRKVYDDVEAAFIKAKADEHKAQTDRVERMKVRNEKGKWVAAPREVKDAILTEIRRAYEMETRVVPYFPLKRFGEHVVRVKPSDDIPEGLEPMEMYETAEEAETRRAQLEAEGIPAYTTKQSVVFGEQFKGAAPQFISDALDAIEKSGASEADKEALKDVIKQQYLRSLPEASPRKANIHRKSVPGFHQDALRSFAFTVIHMNNRIAKLNNTDQMQQAIDDMAEEFKGGESTAGGDMNRKRRRVLDEVERHYADSLSPQHNSVMQGLQTLGFVWFLGGNISTGILNATQTVQFTIPHLYAEFGIGHAASAFKSATAAVANPTRMKINKDGKPLQVEGPKGMTPDEKAAYEWAVDNGIISVTLAHDLAGKAEQGIDITRGRAKTLFMDAMALPQHATERMNREIAFLASYRAARLNGMDAKDARDKAKDFVYKTQFDYSSTNRARYMRNPTARVVTQFKSYSAHVIYRLVRDFNSMMKRNDATPEERLVAKRAFFGTLGGVFLTTGALGLPGLSFLLGVLGAAKDLFDDDDEPEDFEYEMARGLRDIFDYAGIGWVGDLIAHGALPRPLAERAGMQALLIRDSGFPADTQADAAKDLVLQLLGPVLGSMPVKMGRAVDNFNSGHYARALEEVAPNFTSSVQKAVRFAVEGVLDKEKKPIVDDVTTGEILNRALGFQLGRVIEINEERGRQRTVEAYQQARARKLINENLNAKGPPIKGADGRYRYEPDMEKLAESNAKIMEWNKKHPPLMIDADRINAEARSRLREAEAAREGRFVSKKSYAEQTRQDARE